MDPLLTILSQLGLGLATNAIYDVLKPVAGKQVDVKALAIEVQNQINVHGVAMRAETVISAIAQNGYLSIQDSNLYAPQSLTFGSHQGAATVGNNSTLTTDKTAITAGRGAFVQTQGQAQVRQNLDGSISFHVGDNGNINFMTSK